MQHTATTYIEKRVFKGHKFISLKYKILCASMQLLENKIYVTLKSCHRGEKLFSILPLWASASTVTKAKAAASTRYFDYVHSSYEIHEACI